MGEYPPILDLNILKKEMNLTDEAISASGFSPEELQAIYTDYMKRWDDLVLLKNQFVSDFIVSAKGVHLHSYNGRVKEPLHLIEKIIRKRSTNDPKYRNMTPDDYYKYVTDIIGCRILLVYKEDWEPVHNYLISCFPDDPDRYIDTSHYAASYDVVRESPYMAEAPVAHIRLGDAEIYPETLIKVARDRYYRSLHYIVRYKKYYVEIQVRTLFEEAWGEVDHDVLYPYYKDDPLLVGFSELINRAAGMSDEMSAYFRSKLSFERPRKSGRLLDVPLSNGDSTVLMGRTVSKILDPIPATSKLTQPDSSTVQNLMKTLVEKDEV